jgi:hypothetical protein
MRVFYVVYCGQVIRTVKARSRRHAVHRAGNSFGLYQIITAREFLDGRYWR